MPISVDQTATHRMRVIHRINNAKTPKQRNLDVFNYILGIETNAQTRFLKSDGVLYVYLGMAREIYTMPPPNRGGDQIIAYLNAMYGVTQTEPLGRFVYAEPRNYAIINATKATLRRFAAYDTTTHTAYLSNYQGQMWQIDGGTPS